MLIHKIGIFCVSMLFIPRDSLWGRVFPEFPGLHLSRFLCLQVPMFTNIFSCLKGVVFSGLWYPPSRMFSEPSSFPRSYVSRLPGPDVPRILFSKSLVFSGTYTFRLYISCLYSIVLLDPCASKALCSHRDVFLGFPMFQGNNLHRSQDGDILKGQHCSGVLCSQGLVFSGSSG